MGLIIFPFLLGAMAIVIFAAYTISNQVTENIFNPNNIIYGTILTLLIYGAIVLSYWLKKKSWGLSPVFRFPFCMIYLPFFVFLLTKINVGLNVRLLSNSLLVSIVASGAFMVVFNRYIFGILDKLGIQKQY